MQFRSANETDAAAIMQLYRDAIGSEGCTWSMDYPNEEIQREDMTRSGLFCIVNDADEIIGAISIDDDPAVEELDCWSAQLHPAAELARLVVKESYRNQSIARELLREGMQVLRERGYRSVHFLVSQTNERAIRSYAKLDFVNCGESELFGEHWWCYEKQL